MVEDRQKGDVEIIPVDQELIDRFKREHKISDAAMAKAEAYMESMKVDYSSELEADIVEIEALYERYKQAPSETGILKDLNRQVLKVKSNAGMFGYELLTSLCELLFELLDDEYDCDNGRVAKSLGLYISTLQVVYRKGLSDNSSQDAKRLLDELFRLNRSLKK